MAFAGTVVLVGDETPFHRLGDRLQRVVILKRGLECAVLVKPPEMLENLILGQPRVVLHLRADRVD